MTRRRNDSKWRSEVIAKRGDWCRRCKRTGVQADHLVPRSQGGPSVVENGMPLCPECHQLKTEHKVLVQQSWLDPDQVDWLETNRWVWWDEDGEVYGPLRKSYAQAKETR